jgi:two-component system CheB/CheR fusion protein
VGKIFITNIFEDNSLQMPKTTRKTKISSKPIARKKTFPIVAFGASAGGLEAITAILKELSATTGMAYFYLQHQDPNHKSQLVEILSRHTKMKVVQAKNRLRAKINHLFIIPPNRTATLKDGVIVLKSRPTEPGPPTLIDRFFESLAENHKYATIGILLSGNGADGTIGMKAIKVAGGLTMVQDKTAKFQSMPQSAIGDDVVDMVLPHRPTS